MANFLSSLAGCMSGCLSLVARGVLFASCLMIAICQAAYIFTPPGAEDPVGKLASPQHNYAPYFTSGLMIGVALCGLYGACTRDPRSLKLFALLVTIIALLHAFGVYDTHAENQKELTRFNATLRVNQPLYNWSSGSLLPATILWDSVQEQLECCGLAKQSEWLDHALKPPGLAAQSLPESCCSQLARDKPSYVACKPENAFKVGCLDRYKTIINSSVRRGVVRAIACVALILMALFLAEQSSRSPAPRRPVVARYNQFNNSVYTWRQQPQARLVAGEKPPAYVAPNAPPPPSYTFA